MPLQNNSSTTEFLPNNDQFLRLTVLSRTKNYLQSTWKNLNFFHQQPFMKSSRGKFRKLPLLFCIFHLLVSHPKIHSLILYNLFHTRVAWNHTAWNKEYFFIFVWPIHCNVHGDHTSQRPTNKNELWQKIRHFLKKIIDKMMDVISKFFNWINMGDLLGSSKSS